MEGSQQVSYGVHHYTLQGIPGMDLDRSIPWGYRLPQVGVFFLYLNPRAGIIGLATQAGYAVVASLVPYLLRYIAASLEV